jgi:hypothetical protein
MSLIGALRAIANRETWQERALCSQTDPELFFPDKGQSPRHAKTICRQCDVRLECLDYALRNNERFGVWGGTTDYQRSRLNGGIPKPMRRPPDECVNGHKLENPDTDSSHNCRQCAKDKHERYMARVRAGLVEGRRRRDGVA